MKLRVLIVEDEMTIALLMEDIIGVLGHDVVGLAMRFSQAMKLAESEQFDLAILDVNLDGCKSFPIAEVLARRGIRFIFSTGYGSSGIEPPYGDRPVLTKPFDIEKLESAISREFA